MLRISICKLIAQPGFWARWTPRAWVYCHILGEWQHQPSGPEFPPWDIFLAANVGNIFLCTWYRDELSHNIPSVCLMFRGSIRVLKSQQSPILLWAMIRHTKKEYSWSVLKIYPKIRKHKLKDKANYSYCLVPSACQTEVWTFQLTRGTWGADRGQQDIELRDGRWSPAGVDACPGGQAIQDRKRRRGIGCIKSGVAQSQGSGYGGA